MQVFIYLILLISVNQSLSMKMQEVFVWEELEYAWPSEKFKQESIKSGSYIAKNNLPLGFDIWEDKLFITVPR